MTMRATQSNVIKNLTTTAAQFELDLSLLCHWRTGSGPDPWADSAWIALGKSDANKKNVFHSAGACALNPTPPHPTLPPPSLKSSYFCCRVPSLPSSGDGCADDCFTGGAAWLITSHLPRPPALRTQTCRPEASWLPHLHLQTPAKAKGNKYTPAHRNSCASLHTLCWQLRRATLKSKTKLNTF